MARVRDALLPGRASRAPRGREARDAIQAYLDKYGMRCVGAMPDGEAKAEEAKRMIDRVRTFAGYREYPR